MAQDNSCYRYMFHVHIKKRMRILVLLGKLFYKDLLDTVDWTSVGFYILVGFLYSCSIHCWERYVKVSNWNFQSLFEKKTSIYGRYLFLIHFLIIILISTTFFFFFSIVTWANVETSLSQRWGDKKFVRQCVCAWGRGVSRLWAFWKHCLNQHLHLLWPKCYI